MNKKVQNTMDNNKKKILEALTKSLGIVTTACKISGLSRSRFYEYMEQDEEFRQMVDDIREQSIDFAESKLFEQIKENNTACIIFFLKTRGKSRGYVERSELAGVDNNPVNIVIKKQ